MQADLFDLNLATLEREAGQQRAAAHRAALLAKARALAVQVAQQRRDRTVTADDVYRLLPPADIHHLGNAAGSLFRGAAWEFTGRRTRSRRITNHAREIKVWRLI